MFENFRDLVRERFSDMQKVAKENENFVLVKVNVEKEKMWNAYMSAFPHGSNPIHKVRETYDCSCCRSFIKQVGNVVLLDKNGDKINVWDFPDSADIEQHYHKVAKEMSELVNDAPVLSHFLHETHVVGNKSNNAIEDGEVVTYNHFYAKIDNMFYIDKHVKQTKIGRLNNNHKTFKRALDEISKSTVDEVIGLIEDNNLYRGEEHLNALKSFGEDLREYKQAINKDAWMWVRSKNLHDGYARFRNTTIGQLLQNIQDGDSLEVAVKKYEDMVAPTNYKRPKALITQKMIDQAQKKVQELGLENSLARRHAKASDISINQVLYADQTTKKVLNDSPFDMLKPTKSNTKAPLSVGEISIDDFIKNELKGVTKLELFLENKHIPNLVTLVAPVEPEAPSITKWNNNFTWDYKGGATDSIKERVREAGGNVMGDFRASLSWFNYDDLDLHLYTPKGGHIYFREKMCRRTGLKLDVDMNAGGRGTRKAVENIFVSDRKHLVEGTYKLVVDQFQRRESIDVGFVVEIEFLGEIMSFKYDTRVDYNVVVATFNYSHDKGIVIDKNYSLPLSSDSKQEWNLTTKQFHKVDLMTLSPNHWEAQNSNKHYLFMLENCKNPEPVRGFYNEFLKDELNEHRKVFEVLGSKMKAEYTENQLSGLGFSSTIENDIMARINGNKVIKIKF